MDNPGQLSQPYGRIASLIGEERCVVLDGGIGTEVDQVVDSPVQLDERDWGTRALIDAPDTVLDIHRAYVAAGCDLISTNTWGLLGLRGQEAAWQPSVSANPVSWLDVARRALDLARRATAEAEPGNEPAVAFSLNGDLDSDEGRETARLLARLFADGPAPDLLLVETLSVVRPSLLESVSLLLETGIPVWLSFRRCRHGLCGVFGQHWGGPEGDAFGRAAHQFEELGVGALLVNCIPPDHIDGMVSFLRDFTDLPLGVYPNLGYFSDAGWRFDAGVGPEEYARMALRWREEGAQIVGGCCGVRPDHVRAAAVALEDTARGQRRREEIRAGEDGPGAEEAVAAPWVDGRGRRVYPLAFPDLTIEEGVAPPDDAEFMAWRYLAREGVGAHQRCLDIGCGAGLLGIQLALNGAQRVRAIDIDRAAVANTLTNAYRNDVDDRLDAAVVDLYPWVPEEPFDLVVASLAQLPTDPLEAATLHRPTDFWGRGLVDQLLAKLDEALAPDGVAYVVQYSILSQQRTANLVAEHGMSAEVVDFGVFKLGQETRERLAQVELVEELSDAYHLRLGGEQAMVAYLLEVRRSASDLR
jgi:S-methylmethionine-dependent homocysteine/selenocysteine methylase/SAM-dependent methyltransferase